MKLMVGCSECFKVAYEQDKDKTPPYIPTYPYWEYPVIELDKWPYIETECDRGHKKRFTINLELYELLFQQATYCVMDGYYREAIGSYNAALERFFEFVIEILTLKQNNRLNFTELWKQVQNQSERQLGAYYFLWATHFRRNPIFLDQDKVKMRNNVVHKGKLATKEEAVEFGKYIFDYIRDAYKELKEDLAGELIDLGNLRRYRICKKNIESAMNNPIYTIENGDKIYLGIGTTYIPCFLNSKEIKDYRDCFKPDNMKQMEYGLLK